MEDGMKKELTNPSEIAVPISSIYAKLFNDNKESNMDDWKQFLGPDINKISKMSNK